MNTSEPAIDTEHEAVDRLLPWYVNDSLETAERERVDAHLAACAQCRAALVEETELQQNYRDLPVEAAASWTVLRDRIAPRWPDNRRTRGLLAWRRGRGDSVAPRHQTGRVATLLAAQAAVMLFVVVTAGPLMQAINPFGDSYRGLSASTKPPVGNIVAMFRPDTPESALRAALRRVDATIVDGPTSGDAYILRVAPDRRQEQLAVLRAQPSVLLAEPIDAGEQP